MFGYFDLSVVALLVFAWAARGGRSAVTGIATLVWFTGSILLFGGFV